VYRGLLVLHTHMRRRLIDLLPCLCQASVLRPLLPPSLCSKTALSATASFEVRSPKLLQISFEEGRVATPTLLADLQLPSTLDLMGQQVDLSPLQVGVGCMLLSHASGELSTHCHRGWTGASWLGPVWWCADWEGRHARGDARPLQASFKGHFWEHGI
jgi:hypothetical protein